TEPDRVAGGLLRARRPAAALPGPDRREVTLEANGSWPVGLRWCNTHPQRGRVAHALADARQPIATALPAPRRPVRALAARRTGFRRALPGPVPRPGRPFRGAVRPDPLRDAPPPPGRRGAFPRRLRAALPPARRRP